ncbi:MAG: hypothetical protein ACK56I_02895, partial [bacterium]
TFSNPVVTDDGCFVERAKMRRACSRRLRLAGTFASKASNSHWLKVGCQDGIRPRAQTHQVS